MVQRHRLFYQHMLTCFQAGASNLIMAAGVGADDDAINAIHFEHLVNMLIGVFQNRLDTVHLK